MNAARHVSRATSAFHLRFQAAQRDIVNLARYRSAAPRWCECIWVDPAEITRHIAGFREEYSGRIVDGEWDVMSVPLEGHPKLRFAHLRWAEGRSWDDTGAVNFYLEEIELYGARDGCRTEADLRRRLEDLDRIFEGVRQEGRLRTRREIFGRRAFREMGGIRVHVGRDDEPIFGGAGYHRLAMARVLTLPLVPAQIGIVHPQSLGSWAKAFRRSLRPPTLRREST